MVQQFGQMGSKKNFYDFLKSKWLINSITEIVKIRDNSKDLNWYQYNIVDQAASQGQTGQMGVSQAFHFTL